MKKLILSLLGLKVVQVVYDLNDGLLTTRMRDTLVVRKHSRPGTIARRLWRKSGVALGSLGEVSPVSLLEVKDL